MVLLAIKRRGRSFAHAQLIVGQRSRAKIRRGQAVKVVFSFFDNQKSLDPGRSSGHGTYGSDPPPPPPPLGIES